MQIPKGQAYKLVKEVWDKYNLPEDYWYSQFDYCDVWDVISFAQKRVENFVDDEDTTDDMRKVNLALKEISEWE